MPNIASVLKEEIARVARKEIRGETEKLKQASTLYRSEIATLKRRVTELERKLSRLDKGAGKQHPSQAGGDANRQVRYSATGLQKLRQRLDLSAPKIATLLGVSAQTIYNWEAGTTRPAAEQIAAIAVLRRASKSEVAARLTELKK